MEGDLELFRVERSGKNQAMLGFLVLGTIFWWFIGLRVPFLVFAVLSVTQILRTFVMCAVFLEDRVEYRNLFGAWIGIAYDKALLLEDRGFGITIMGDDLMDRPVSISLRDWDGDLEEAIRIFHSQKSK